jgi:hypothetical protein
MAQATDAFNKHSVTALTNGGVAIAASAQPLDNHNTVVVQNKSATVTALVEILEKGAGAVPGLSATTAIEVGPGSSYPIPIGTTATREPYGTATGEKTLYYNGVGATAELQVIYHKKVD